MNRDPATAHSIRNLTFEHRLGGRRTAAGRERASVMSRALPQIESYYEELRRSKQEALGGISPDQADEALDFYNAVVADGRYVDLLRESPKEAADQLGMDISDEVLRAVRVVSDRLGVGGPVEGPVEAVIAVAVVIVLAPKLPAGAEGLVIEDNARITVRL